ncbi:AI-2E family transporter [Williamsia muralis]|uniref:AI-2E family transporter n=1 Tax=Williamsia marianensis TaxID=85044 RepID=UPI0037FB1F3C
MPRTTDERIGPVSAWSLPRGVIVLLGSAALIVTVAGLKSFADILGPVMLALMLTVAVHPLPDWLRRRGVPNSVAILAAVLAVYAVLAVLVVSLVISVAQLSQLLPTYSDEFDDLVTSLKDTLHDNGIGPEQVQDMLAGVDSTKVFGFVEDLLQGFLGVFSNLIFVVVLLLFMAADGISYTPRITLLRQSRPDIAVALTSFSAGTRSYLMVTTVFGLIVASLDTLALWAMDIPLPVLWGLLAFITNYIPNIGFVLGVAPPALLALLEGGPGLMLAVIAVYSVLNVVIQSVIQPKFVGDAVGLSVTLTFLSLVFWSWVLGPLGAILAVPLTLMAKAFLVDIDPATRWADIFLSGSPPRAEPVAALEHQKE